MAGKGLEDLFQLYLRHNHGCMALSELGDESLPEILSVVTCWGYVLGAPGSANTAAGGAGQP